MLCSAFIYLPSNSNDARITKASITGAAKITKDVKECMQECMLEFFSFVLAEAAEKCQLEKRKTIGCEDMLFVMINFGFENYAQMLKIYLAGLRQVSSVDSVGYAPIVSCLPLTVAFLAIQYRMMAHLFSMSYYAGGSTR